MNQAHPAVWNASEARHRFSDRVDAVVGGEGQFVRRRDGREGVVVSREYCEGTRPSLKDWMGDASLKLADDFIQIGRQLAPLRLYDPFTVAAA